MKRFCLILTLCGFWGILAAVFAQVPTTGIIRGNIVDTSEAQLPIEGVLVVMVNGANGLEYETVTDSNGEYRKHGMPPGRYLISIYKEGYGDRVGKPVTVVAGGDHYIPLKMTKKGLITALQRQLSFLLWLLLLCFGFF